jgi:hypothetical protein
MTIEIPTNEPLKIVAGDYVQWKRELSDFPADDGWVLTYTLLNATTKITITAAADGADHLVTLAIATTAAYTAGEYTWQAYATKAATSQRYKVDEGTMEVEANFAALSTLDARTHVKKVLDAIEAVIENRATLDQEEYSIQGRSLRRTPMEDLLTLHKRYKRLYAEEQNRERLRNGLGGSNRLLMRF